MSRSYRHHAITGVTTSRSEKREKRLARRILRHEQEKALKLEKEVLPHKNEISDIYDFSKDGKMWFDKNKYPKYMRK